jgi:EmrB/QacA subfamily drug resistance transporter
VAADGNVSWDDGTVRWGGAPARWILLITILGSSLGFIDATVVTIAVPAIGRELDGDAGSLTWVVNAYTLTLASFILLGGSLGDRFGRRRIYLVGVTWFAVASLLCGVAPTIGALNAARALQGVGAALLTPGALAIIEASFDPASRSRAIGAWSGLAGISGAVAPFLGGWLVQLGGWRLVFLINLPFSVAVVALGLRHLPESKNPDAAPHLDLAGAALCALGLAGVTYGLSVWTSNQGPDASSVTCLVAGLVGLVAFVVVEGRSRHPMVPLSIFRYRVFSAVNLVTLLVYAALAGVFFFVVVQLQVVSGYSPVASGIALLPVTGILVAFSSRVGGLSARTGPRVLMTAGPLLAGSGLAWLSRIGAEASYLADVLPGLVLLGGGLALTVAPLTSVALGSAPDRLAGVASGVNNAVARTAGLLAIALLPLLSGLQSLTDPVTLAPAYRTSLLICAGLMAGGAALAWATMPNSYDAMRAGITASPPSRSNEPEQ